MQSSSQCCSRATFFSVDRLLAFWSSNFHSYKVVISISPRLSKTSRKNSSVFKADHGPVGSILHNDSTGRPSQNWHESRQGRLAVWQRTSSSHWAHFWWEAPHGLQFLLLTIEAGRRTGVVHDKGITWFNISIMKLVFIWNSPVSRLTMRSLEESRLSRGVWAINSSGRVEIKISCIHFSSFFLAPNLIHYNMF